jgi:hypothetical protein
MAGPRFLREEVWPEGLQCQKMRDDQKNGTNGLQGKRAMPASKSKDPGNSRVKDILDGGSAFCSRLRIVALDSQAEFKEEDGEFFQLIVERKICFRLDRRQFLSGISPQIVAFSYWHYPTKLGRICGGNRRR